MGRYRKAPCQPGGGRQNTAAPSGAVVIGGIAFPHLELLASVREGGAESSMKGPLRFWLAPLRSIRVRHWRIRIGVAKRESPESFLSRTLVQVQPLVLQRPNQPGEKVIEI